MDFSGGSMFLLVLLLFLSLEGKSQTLTELAQEGDDVHMLKSIQQHKRTIQLIDKLTGPNSGYNKQVIPPTGCHFDKNGSQCPFIVRCRLFLIRVQEIYENSETLVTSARLQLGWDDPALRWNPENYGGITAVILPPNSIWWPNLQFVNSVDNIFVLNDDQSGFRVTYDGHVWYHPTAKFSTRCSLDLTYYPFDYQ